NGDGKLDLAVANLLSNNVSILLGSGAGTFGSASQFATGFIPRSVAVGDFNKDGKPDLAVPLGSGPLAILLGNGNGSFGAATSFGGGPTNPSFAAIGDFNGDSNLDIAVTNEGDNTLTILLGLGNGTFTSHATLAVGSQPRSVVTADFNGDGRKDLAVANLGSNNVSVLIGVGNGDFGAVVNFAAGTSPTAVIARDLNADGKQELVIANNADTKFPLARVTVLLGSGTGSFGSPASFIAGDRPRGVDAADFNRDGHLDLVVANQSGNNVSVLLGEVLPVLQVSPSQKPNDTSSYALRRTSIWIERQVPSTGLFSHAMYADINKDGFVDFVRTFQANADMRRPIQVMMGGANGTFTDQTASVITTSQPGILVTRKILTADFNGDGWPDFFLLNHGLDDGTGPGEFPQLFLSNGNGTLRYVPGLEGAQYTYFNHGGAAADIDGNGTVDVLVANPTSPFFLINDGTGHFVRNANRLPLALIGASFGTTELIDVDSDGFIDLIAGGGSDGTRTTIFWGGASGVYRSSRSTVLPSVPNRAGVLDFAVEDIDRDG
ncbi:MAG: VCBS repeat-containing protein, partial [Dehalococcoidia bacterium]